MGTRKYSGMQAITLKRGQKMAEQWINVDYLARVEGEGALRIHVSEGAITDVQLNIFEPPRFFEAFLKGRDIQETVDIVARICGICPIAYQITASRALEKSLGITPPPGIPELRRLIYLSEWIESHGLHVYMLHAPDFLGYESAIEMAGVPELRETVERGLRMKKIGNHLMSVIGGREIHPISLCVGGFTRAPHAEELRVILPDLEWGLEAALETVRWANELPYPDFECDYEFVGLSHPDEYAIAEGTVRSSKGLDIPIEEYEKNFIEEHVARSNALHSRRSETNETYLVGPLARMNHNAEQFTPTVKAVMDEIGLELPVKNPFMSLMARSLEIAHAFDEAINLIREYEEPGISRAPLPESLAPGEGAHVTEAPRGLIYHRYKLDDKGLIAFANIVPPTAQNLPRMEEDLWKYATRMLDLPLEEATLKCEQLIRSYDPCISCSTHFLKLEINWS
jgi:sulfhydrogenase subunit alpha